MIPAKVNLCGARVVGFDPIQNDGLMLEHLDWLKERREVAIIRLVEYQQRLVQRYNRDVKAREFSVGDLVLRKVEGNMRDTSVGKLAQTWEGPYRVTAIVGVGA